MTSYADTYNSFFLRFANSRLEKTLKNRAVDRWVRQRVRGRVSHRYKTTQHLIKISHTQSIGRNLSPTTRQWLQTEHDLAKLAWVTSHLRPLQRRILQRLWHPHGPMATRNATHCINMFNATRNESAA